MSVMKMPANGAGASSATAAPNPSEGEKRSINPELWQACAGPLVNLPAAGTHVVYFPQGHSEQVAAPMTKDVDAQIPNYPNLPSKLLCLLLNVTLHADPETDEVCAQMTLQPVPSIDKDALLKSDLSMKANKPVTEFFCKTLTASDTSTHGGFSVPRRAAEKIFPPLDFTMQPPCQEIVARDLHDNVWNFRHIYRGQPKRHLLTMGWSLFVGGKRLLAGDSVLFIRDERQQLLLGTRWANRQPTNLSSSVISSNSMHLGILATAAHAAANSSPFTVFYNPRASPSEFVLPLAKYYKTVCSNQISLGMRFRMMFETEESGTRRYMGTITGISDLDPVRWKNSQWRSLEVGWDESTDGERLSRVSIWEIEPVTAPFCIYPSKHRRQPGMRGRRYNTATYLHSIYGSVLQDLPGADLTRQQGLPATQILRQNNLQFDTRKPTQQEQPTDPSVAGVSITDPPTVTPTEPVIAATSVRDTPSITPADPGATHPPTPPSEGHEGEGTSLGPFEIGDAAYQDFLASFTQHPPTETRVHGLGLDDDPFDVFAGLELNNLGLEPVSSQHDVVSRQHIEPVGANHRGERVVVDRPEEATATYREAVDQGPFPIFLGYPVLSHQYGLLDQVHRAHPETFANFRLEVALVRSSMLDLLYTFLLRLQEQRVGESSLEDYSGFMEHIRDFSLMRLDLSWLIPRLESLQSVSSWNSLRRSEEDLRGRIARTEQEIQRLTNTLQDVKDTLEQTSAERQRVEGQMPLGLPLDGSVLHGLL